LKIVVTRGKLRHYEHMRIIQVVNVRWFNATAWYGFFLARLLRDAGHDVRVLGLSGTESFAKAEEWGLAPTDCPLNSSNPLRVAEAYGKIRRIVCDFSPHIVNCHRGEGFILWSLLKNASSENPFALIRTRGDQRPPRGGFVNRYLHADAADAVIATSSSIAGNVRSILHVPAANVRTIYGGVDTAKFYPDPEGRVRVRASLGLHDAHTAIGLVGRFDEVKGQKELIASFARMRESLGEKAAGVRLVLAGFATSSTSVEAVKSRAEEAGVAGAVVYPGRCDDVRGLMNALDVGVVASLGSETIARVALEIMACGVPLIGTRVGVMPDLLEDETLVSPGDEKALAEALARFMTDGGYGKALCFRQKERMATLRERDFYEQTMDVYQSVLKNKG
jgi:glycosyltransferase involved in cell wall biosynthesis